ncbi:MAG: hypothetical protein ABI693_16810 [Bryobacteraceae bacterium]
MEQNAGGRVVYPLHTDGFVVFAFAEAKKLIEARTALSQIVEAMSAIWAARTTDAQYLNSRAASVPWNRN